MDTGRSVLVIGTPEDALAALAAADDDARVFVVLPDATPRTPLDGWEAAGAESPSHVVTLDAGLPDGCDADAAVESASGPAELAAALRTGLDDRADSAVYVDAVDALADALGPELTFRLLHVLTRDLTHAGGNAYARAPPDADETLVETLAPLFDDVER